MYDWEEGRELVFNWSTRGGEGNGRSWGVKRWEGEYQGLCEIGLANFTLISLFRSIESVRTKGYLAIYYIHFYMRPFALILVICAHPSLPVMWINHCTGLFTQKKTKKRPKTDKMSVCWKISSSLNNQYRL